MKEQNQKTTERWEAELDDTPEYSDIPISYGGAIIAEVLNADSLEQQGDEDDEGDKIDAEARRTAEFIVRACNAHEALVKALAGAIGTCALADVYVPRDIRDWAIEQLKGDPVTAIKHIREAIALTGGANNAS